MQLLSCGDSKGRGEPLGCGRWRRLWSPVSDWCLELSREIHNIWWAILTPAFILEPRNDEIPIWEMLRKIGNYFACTEISCFIILITWYIDIATYMHYPYSGSSVRNVCWESFVRDMHVWARQVDSFLSRNFRLWFIWPILDTYTKTRLIWRSESYPSCLYCSGRLLKLQQSFWGLL